MSTSTPGPTLRARVGWLSSTTALVAVTALFAMAHWQYWRRTGDPKGVCFAIQEIAVVVVALGRRPPIEISHRRTDWAYALLGSYTVLLLRPGGSSPRAIADVGLVLQLVGGIAAACCIFELGRSFGVVAANRGIKSGGLYRIVRHPIYAAYAIAMAGYLLAAPTLTNAVVVSVAMMFQVRRMYAEEAVLVHSAEYRSYARAVPWRLLPGII